MSLLLSILLAAHAQSEPIAAPSPEAEAAPASATTDLVVRIRQVEAQTGGIYVILFNDPDAFPDKPDGALDSRLAKPSGPEATVTFEGLTPGTYALFAFHDVNGNKDLDVRSVIPIPKEPVAASRDAKGRFGPPKFSNAQFEVPAAPTQHTEVLNLGTLL